MKLAFSTLGCPNWELEQIVQTAKSLGYQGVELRAVGGTLDLLARPEFQISQLSNTRRWFSDQEIQICCIDTSCTFHSPRKSERVNQVDLAVKHAEIAAQLGAPLIRVFPDKVQEGTTWAETRDNISWCLHEVAKQIPLEVQVCLETHGDFARGEITADIIKRADHPNVSTIWDIANSMAAGDSMEAAALAVRPFLAHVHLRDAKPVENSEHWLPVLAGRGLVHFPTALKTLRDVNYDGYISFEWEKYWHPEIEEPEVAFADFIQAINASSRESNSVAGTPLLNANKR